MTLQPPRTPPRRSPGTNEREARDTGRPIGFGGGLFGRTDGRTDRERSSLSSVNVGFLITQPFVAGEFSAAFTTAQKCLLRLPVQGKRQSKHRLEKRVERRCPLPPSLSVRHPRRPPRSLPLCSCIRRWRHREEFRGRV